MHPPIENAERRSHRRYPIELEVSWKLTHARRVLKSGTGMTRNLSSGGLLFECDRELPPDLRIEASIAWPVPLRNVVPLQLVISGIIVRTDSRCVAVSIRHYEFRTVALVRRGHNRRHGSLHPREHFSDSLK